jgi:transcriptional regulator GlxA family with amidase domain
MRDSEAFHLLSSPPDDDFAAALRTVILGFRQHGWISVDRAAKLAGMSTRTLQRKLAAEGRTYSDLLVESQLELAVEMLENTAASMDEIASATGYSAVPNFTRAFRRKIGKAPAEFRRNRAAREK